MRVDFFNGKKLGGGEGDRMTGPGPGLEMRRKERKGKQR